MTEAHMKSQLLYENLKDIGFDDEEAECCMKYYREQNVQKMMQILNKRRKTLLADLHEKQSNIDCLDYLVYQIKMNGGIRYE